MIFLLDMPSFELTSRTVTSLFALVYGIVIIGIAFFVKTKASDTAITVLVFTLGAVLGWLVAGMISPYDEAEKDVFTSVGKTITAFVTGYVVSKTDKLVQAYIDVLTDEIKGPVGIKFDDLQKIRLMGFFISFVVSAITVYVHRASEYSQEQQSISTSADTVRVKKGAVVLIDTVKAKKVAGPKPKSATAKTESSTVVKTDTASSSK